MVYLGEVGAFGNSKVLGYRGRISIDASKLFRFFVSVVLTVFFKQLYQLNPFGVTRFTRQPF